MPELDANMLYGAFIMRLPIYSRDYRPGSKRSGKTPTPGVGRIFEDQTDNRGPGNHVELTHFAGKPIRLDIYFRYWKLWGGGRAYGYGLSVISPD
ncbi:hypothetical protein KM043_006009 [Ampulex compressa]|nr:hypothetical protein KM043_006009 [Ampulex compressa]